MVWVVFFFFKQKTAYEMRISDWSSDVCSSDLRPADPDPARKQAAGKDGEIPGRDREGARSGRGQPVEQIEAGGQDIEFAQRQQGKEGHQPGPGDRKSTRLNSSQ